MLLKRQDRQGVRRPADVDRRYGIEKTKDEIKLIERELLVDPKTKCLYRNYNTKGEKEWLNPPVNLKGKTYRTFERFFGSPVFTMLVSNLADVPEGYTVIRKSETVTIGSNSYTQIWLIDSDGGIA
jgi:hypothetical protein